MFIFTALLVALLIDRLLGFHSQTWVQPAFSYFLKWVQHYLALSTGPRWFSLAAILIPLILLSGILWSLFSLTFITHWLGAVFFIWAALGWVDTQSLIDHLSPSAKTSEKVVAHAIYWQAGQATFSVIFWLLLTGPLGAIIYRWIVLANAKELQEILDWLPMRLFSATLILVDGSQANWRLWWQNKTVASEKLIDTCGAEHAVDRVNRSLFAWLLILAVWAVITSLV